MSMSCRNCGLPVSAGDAFCENCGNPVAAGANPQDSGRADGGMPPAEDAGPQPAQGAAEAAVAEITARLASGQLNLNPGMSSDSFDPLRNKRFLGQIIRRFGIYALVGVSIQFTFFLFQVIISLSSGSVPSFGGPLSVLSTLFWLVLILACWLLPVPGLLGQWSNLLSHQASAAEHAFDCISQAIDRHATPRDTLRVRGYPLPGEGHRRFLELHRGPFTGFVSCFPHGNDLYVGYSFWIYMSPLQLLFMRIGRSIQNWTGRGNDMYQTLRYESTRATVDAIHACTAEGIDMAICRATPGRGPGWGPAVPAPAQPMSGGPAWSGDQARQQVRGSASPG